MLKDHLITEIDEALLSYEKTVAVASEEGIDIGTKEVRYEWTYVQSVFFSSTIITTVGETFEKVDFYHELKKHILRQPWEYKR